MPDGTAPTDERRDAHQDKKDRYHALREVRHTILRLIGDHYRIPEGDRRSWQGCNLDLTGVTIDGIVNFHGAVFSGGTVHFGDVLSDGSMDFEVTFGPAPVGLLEAVGTPVPSEVRLRADWLPDPH
ncbi:hypothetical protein QBC31_22340 [Streptomyces sp. B21-079]|uniref:hypothetical protein n=1 Tax=Streptomyces sp. B21-079 TaxID=3039409 RepID=UPI002FF20F11